MIPDLLGTVFYIGKLPIAPGTWGSLVGLILWWFLPIDFLLQLSLIILLFIIGLYSSKIISIRLNNNDPSEVVIDEIVGISISLFMLPNNFQLYVLAFLLFRIFDILKPSFIYDMQKFPNGWGIMLDDVAAGVITFLIMQGILTI